jgi:hypothetical protein
VEFILIIIIIIGQSDDSVSQSVNPMMGDQKFSISAPPCFGRHVKTLVPAAFIGRRGGLWPVLLMYNP